MEFEAEDKYDQSDDASETGSALGFGFVFPFIYPGFVLQNFSGNRYVDHFPVTREQSIEVQTLPQIPSLQRIATALGCDAT